MVDVWYGNDWLCWVIWPWLTCWVIFWVILYVLCWFLCLWWHFVYAFCLEKWTGTTHVALVMYSSFVLHYPYKHCLDFFWKRTKKNVCGTPLKLACSLSYLQRRTAIFWAEIDVAAHCHYGILLVGLNAAVSTCMQLPRLLDGGRRFPPYRYDSF